MRLLLLAAALFALWSPGGAARGAEPIVSYTIAPVLSGGALSALDVTMQLHASSDGTTRLRLPDHAGGAEGLWHYLQDIWVEGAAEVSAEGDALRIIRSAPNAPLTIRYRVVSAFDHDPTPRDFDPYKPTIRPRWFWVYGEALFVRTEDETARFRLIWHGPADFPFATDLGTKALSINASREGILLGGPDLRLAHGSAAGAPVRFASIGQFGFSDHDYIKATLEIIAAERRFWHTREGTFLVALAPVAPMAGQSTIRGEGRHGAFAVMAMTTTPLGSLREIIAHEYFHHWNPGQLGDLPDGDDEPLGYWFSEGFTDYFARRLLLRSGGLSLEDFVARWNETLAAYGTSPVRTEPNARIAKDFWHERFVRKLPYQRGALLAVLWDYRLRQSSAGHLTLDNILHQMRERAAKLGTASPKAPALFAETTRTGGLDLSSDMTELVGQGAAVTLPADAFGPCLPLHTETVPVFALGYDSRAAHKTGVISGVIPDSPAFAAGLRDGMRLKFDAGEPENSRVPWAVTVEADGAERKISFLPQGSTTLALQQITLPDAMTSQQRAECHRQAAFD